MYCWKHAWAKSFAIDPDGVKNPDDWYWHSDAGLWIRSCSSIRHCYYCYWMVVDEAILPQRLFAAAYAAAASVAGADADDASVAAGARLDCP